MVICNEENEVYIPKSRLIQNLCNEFFIAASRSQNKLVNPVDLFKKKNKAILYIFLLNIYL